MHRLRLFSKAGAANSSTAHFEHEELMLLKHPRRGGDDGNLRVLMISTDNRPLTFNDAGAQSYVAMSSVLNHDYALRHGYDFLKVTAEDNLLLMKVQQLFCHHNESKFCELDSKQEMNSKYGFSSFHPGLLQVSCAIVKSVAIAWSNLQYLRAKLNVFSFFLF